MNCQEILQLIDMKQEGEYWDFKREWYSKNNTSDMLHDIICMSNNLANRDAYIIIGIDEENDYSVFDVSEDSNRRNTQQIVDFLRSQLFAGDIRPVAYVENIQTEQGIIDIIVIKNSDYTPFYLTEMYKGIHAYNIYTRIQDTNTPKNSSAAIKDVEYLWKKRFKLLVPPLEKVKYLLTNRAEWVDGPEQHRMSEYHSIFPEYQIEHVAEPNKTGYEYYLFNQTDSKPHWYDINIYYHQTMLASICGTALDGGRYFTSTPDYGYISLDKYNQDMIVYGYYIKDSLRYIIHNYYASDREHSEAYISRQKFMECIVVFESDYERKAFEKYAKSKWKYRNEYIDKYHLPFFPELEGYNMDAFRKQYEDVQILKIMYEEFLKR